MDTDSPKLKAAPSFRRRFETSKTSSDGESETDDLLRYTSLKDIILSSSPKHAMTNNEPGNNISIRNELVKHAASAYVLSATIINPTNTGKDWFSCELCEEVKNISCVDLQSWWEVHVRSTLRTLCRPVFDLFYRVVHRLRNGSRGMEEIT